MNMLWTLTCGGVHSGRHSFYKLRGRGAPWVVESKALEAQGGVVVRVVGDGGLVVVVRAGMWASGHVCIEA